MDTYRWQVAQRHSFVHQHSGNLSQNAEICAMKSILVSCVDGWRTFTANCEEIHNLSKLSGRSHIAENLCCGDDTPVEATVDPNWLFAGI